MRDYKQEITDLIAKIGDEQKRKGMQELFDYAVTNLRLLTTPASSKYHHSYEGGLASHSLEVVKYGLMINKSLNAGLNSDSIILVGLCHDIGKCGTPSKPMYAWQYGKLNYSFNQPTELSHAQRSLTLACKFIHSLSEWEEQAILCHDGQYIEANKAVAMKECPLTLVIHMADVWSARFEDGNIKTPEDEVLP